MVVILLSFVTGILISEIAHRIFYTILNKYTLRFSHLEMNKLKLPESLAVNALKHLGVYVTDACKISEEIQKNLFYIYGEIQVDSKYKRIHNYASCEVLYRNMAMSLCVLEIFVIFARNMETHYKIWISLLFIIGAILMAIRAYRFMIKKELYAVYWFIEKYGTTTVKKSSH